MESSASQPDVPGVVRLMTDEPVVLPAGAAEGGGSALRDQLEERPWLLAAGVLELLGFFLLLRAARSR